MTLGQGLKGLAKSGVTSLASAGASWLSAGVGDTIAGAGLGSITASVASTVASTYVNAYASATIQALDFNHGFKFNKDTFKAGVAGVGKSALSAAY